MKRIFSLVLLSGVFVVLVSAKYKLRTLVANPEWQTPRSYCQLPVNNVPGGEQMICLGQLDQNALEALIHFLQSERLSTASIVCVIRQINDGIVYQVQYGRNKLVTISLSFSGKANIVDNGYLRAQWS